MADIRVGDRVKFRAGRGYSTGRVANIAEGMATIATDAGKNVNRMVKMCELVEVPHSEPAPTCSAQAV